MYSFTLTKCSQDRQTLQNSDEEQYCQYCIGSYVWLFLLDFPKTEIAC